MAQRVGQKVKLSSIDELLGVPSTEGTVDLDVLTIYPFENHPFRVVDDEKMDELVESIKESGVLTPVLVRPDDEGTYEMISGHRSVIAELSRHLATKPDYLLGFETEEDPYVITAVAILQGIKDEKIKALLIGQMQLAGKLGM